MFAPAPAPSGPLARPAIRRTWRKRRTPRRVRRLRGAIAATLAVLAAGLALAVASLPWPTEIAALAVAHPHDTAIQAARRAEAERVGRPWAPRQEQLRLAAFPPSLITLVLLGEDLRFVRDGGVPWRALPGLVLGDPWRQRQGAGAGSLAIQVAQALWLGPRHDAVARARRVAGGAMLERGLPKDRILELYLNETEWGPGVFGAEAASHAAFGKPARRLAEWEAARLVVVLRDPLMLAPADRDGEVPRRAAQLLEHYSATR